MITNYISIKFKVNKSNDSFRIMSNHIAVRCLAQLERRSQSSQESVGCGVIKCLDSDRQGTVGNDLVLHKDIFM